MSNVLIIYEVKDNTTDNNISYFTTILSQIRTDCRVVKSSRVSANDINWCDVCIANRPNSPYSLSVVKALKRAGRFVVVSLDDDIINLPSEHPSYWRRRYTIKCLEIGDALLSPNPLILEDYCMKYHLRSILTSSFVEEKTIKFAHKIKDIIKIVYPAGKDHVKCFNILIEPFFESLMAKYKGKIDVTFVGVEPKVKESEAVHFVKGMPYDDYLIYMKDNHFDIGIAPLEDNPFCARKYYPKYLEYSRFGIAGIYSNVAPYTFILENMKNGVLVNDDPLKWEKALIKLIENPQIIKDIVANAQKDIRERFSLEHAVTMLREGCPELENFHCDGNVTIFNYPRCSILNFKLRDFCSKAFYHFQHDGIKYCLHKINLNDEKC